MKKILFAAVVGSSLMLTYSASALIIDHFEAGNAQTAVYSPPIGSFPSSQLVTGADALGGTRGAAVTRLTGVNEVSMVSDYSSSVMGFSTGASSTGRFQLQYYGTGAGFAATDLTLNSAIGVSMRVINGEYFNAFIMGAMDVNFVYKTWTVVADPATFVDEILFPFAASGFAGVDFTKIIALDFTINGVDQTDFSIDFIGTRGRTVPDAAGTMTLLSLAIGLLGVARWKLNA